jgi:hypothetical protein
MIKRRNHNFSLLPNGREKFSQPSGQQSRPLPITIGLYFHIQSHRPWQNAEDCYQGGDSFMRIRMPVSGTGVEPFQCSRSPLPNSAAHSRGPIQPAIMNHHQFPVKAQADVQFNHVRLIPHSLTKCRKRVLRRYPGTPAMGNHQH